MKKDSKTFLSLPDLNLVKSKKLNKKLKNLQFEELKLLSMCPKTAKKLADEIKLSTRQRNAIPKSIEKLCQQYAYADVSELDEHGWIKIKKRL